MMQLFKRLCVLFFLLFQVTLVAAQESCPVIVQSALQTTDAACATTGRNQACYGNIAVNVIPYEDIADLKFNTVGDMAAVTDIRTLQLSALDTTTEAWGVALMKLQANLPDTLPGQNVTFLLFGDVEITSLTEPAPLTLEVTANGGINVRSGPSTNNAVIGALANGQSVTAVGRNEAGDWLTIQLDDSTLGWAFASLLTVDGDATALSVVAADADTTVSDQSDSAATAFVFKSGIGDAPCAEAPDSGILIQTPEGAAEVQFTLNGVDIALASTAFVQAQPDGEMRVALVEGQARVAAFDKTVTVPAGTQARVPLDAEGFASGPPIGPEPYEDNALQPLPVSGLSREVEVASALTEDEIQDWLLSGAPTLGTWHWSWDETEVPCGDSSIYKSGDNADGFDVEITLSDSGAALQIGHQDYVPIGFGVYEGVSTSEIKNTDTDVVTGRSRTTRTLEVIAADRIRGTEQIEWDTDSLQCTAIFPFTVEMVSAAQAED